MQWRARVVTCQAGQNVSRKALQAAGGISAAPRVESVHLYHCHAASVTLHPSGKETRSHGSSSFFFYYSQESLLRA
ncbi:hypothetical protein RRG08_047149 [Elysia crispata]|uniref:Uncharacterized protein n=1 Tax=Elysia crispata TaxID=231223 RepID=A0AAE0YP04_9GAST|nr:hypothetical protein RRG08_047149 [Elysia crispata]